MNGGARQVASLIAGLARLGVDNVLLCPRGSAIARSVAAAEIVELPLHGDLDLAQTGRLARALRDLAPDLLHVHSRRGADLYGGISARRAGLPAVLTRRVESAELALWARRKLRSYARVIAISSAVHAELTERFGLDPAAVTLVPSAVDTEVYRPCTERGRLMQLFELPPDSIVLGNVAQLIPRKGHGTLLRAFARLAAADPRIYLICFGRGPLAAALERQVAGLGLAGRVRLAGFRDDLAELLPELDVLVHPAEREGLGVAVLEALAAGVPVVGARAGGVPDVIEDGLTGLLAAPGDDAAFAAAIARVLADAGLREMLIVQGRCKVVADFSIARMARGNLDVYREVIGGHGTDG